MGIQAGGYRSAAEFQANGVSYPFYRMEVEMNAYSFASTLDITAPIYPIDASGKLPKQGAIDFNALSQQTALVPLAVRVGYEAASGNAQQPIQLFSLEQGYIDESTYTYDANEIHVVGRSTASRFQDARIATPNSLNLTGSQLVQKLFGQAGIPITINGTSGTYVGKGYTANQYLRAYRARSQWDEMADAALKDGFILTVHNGQGYYGQPGGLASPTVNLAWGADLTACAVNHAARRSHDISVTVDSYVKYTQQKTTATYAARSGSQGENFRFFISGLDRAGCRARAYAIWKDLVKREFIATLTLVPDPAFLRLLAANGPNFLVQLGGCLPAHNILYHVKKATVTINAAEEDSADIQCELILENHAPIQGQGNYV